MSISWSEMKKMHDNQVAITVYNYNGVNLRAVAPLSSIQNMNGTPVHKSKLDKLKHVKAP